MAQQRIVIDGYNLIHQMPELVQHLDRDLEHARDRLVMLLADYGARRKVGVTVVFDGQGFSGQQSRPTGGVEVVFSRPPQNADARIKAMLQKERHPRACTVVTSDKSIILYARDLGATVVRSEDFAAALVRPSANRKSEIGNRKSEKPEMSAADVAEWEDYFKKKGGPETSKGWY